MASHSTEPTASAVLGILAFLAGQLTNLAGRQVDGNQRLGEMQARATVDRERIKAEGQIAKLDGQMQLKQFMFMVTLLKPLLTQAARQPVAEIEEEGETINLDAIRSWQWTEKDL